MTRLFGTARGPAALCWLGMSVYFVLLHLACLSVGSCMDLLFLQGLTARIVVLDFVVD